MPEHQTRDSIRDVYGPRTPYAGAGRWPARVDERTTAEPDRWVQSCCVLCSNGCGLDIGVKDGRIVGVRGRAADGTSRGRLGPKGLHGWEANNSPDRLKRPLIRTGGRLREASWDEAMRLIVQKSQDLLGRFGGHAIGIYGTGQAFLEEYYTTAAITKAGLRTPHKDGNTRLCTATAEWALQETFGSDGQPGSYADIDVADTLLLCGHNVASQQTVLWMRILDRLEGPEPPQLVVIDPRTTETARRATVHLAPRVGTNLAVMNGLIDLILRSGRADADFLRDHTVGLDGLRDTVAGYPPERVEQITGIPAAQLRRAADVLGSARRLVSTVLQGFYQSHQATAASVQVNNLNLVRGMIGRPGCTVLQMNGQPTSENTRECGADGSFPAFFNFENPDHMEALARHWNVARSKLPAYQPPTHAMQIFRYCEAGSIRLLWITATNPAVSMPDSARVRRILKQEGLFVVAQDAFPTETTELADVVLPAAIWGEKAGTFTNTDRTVHLSLKAVEPPGEARPDFDIYIDYARRMGFQDKDGAPLIKWSTPEEAFDHFKELTRGRLCDYSGLSYAKLAGGPGIRWPCNDRHPDGAERLYADHRFPTSFGECETFGHDLRTAADIPGERYRADDPGGRAILKAADYEPPAEQPDGEYPFWLTTGRVVHQFHTRTKTGRSARLREASPDAFVQLAAGDAGRLGIAAGEMVEVESRRGRVLAPARVGDIPEGHVFVPFHFGYWDEPGRPRAANEMTAATWDPISKQPHLKAAAVRVRKAAPGQAAAAFPNPAEVVRMMPPPPQGPPPGRHVDRYVGMARVAAEQLGEAFRVVAAHHPQESEVVIACRKFAGWSERHASALGPFAERYREERDDGPARVRAALFGGPRPGGLGLMRDVHDLAVMARDAEVGWIALNQVARALDDPELRAASEAILAEVRLMAGWCQTQFKDQIAQALLTG